MNLGDINIEMKRLAKEKKIDPASQEPDLKDPKEAFKKKMKNIIRFNLNLSK